MGNTTKNTIIIRKDIDLNRENTDMIDDYGLRFGTDEGVFVMRGSDVNVVKSIKALEWVKTEILNNVAHLFKVLLHNEFEKALSVIAKIIINCFLLGKRLGLNYGQIDMEINKQASELAEKGHQLEEWYGDISALKAYMDMKR